MNFDSLFFLCFTRLLQNKRPAHAKIKVWRGPTTGDVNHRTASFGYWVHHEIPTHGRSSSLYHAASDSAPPAARPPTGRKKAPQQPARQQQPIQLNQRRPFPVSHSYDQRQKGQAGIPSDLMITRRSYAPRKRKLAPKTTTTTTTRPTRRARPVMKEPIFDPDRK